jgi:hypothetical protein
MKRFLILCSAYLLLPCTPMAGQTLFFADFENGVSRNTSGGTWTRYPGAIEWLQSDTSHNHTPGGSLSARAVEADPYTYNSYADFGATSGGLRATVYSFEDMTYVPPYLDHPVWKRPYIEVRSMFSLFSQPPSGPGDPLGDYIQIRLIPDVVRPENPAPDHYSYGIRTKYNDDHGLGIIDTGVLRKESEWLKLVIEVDSVAEGGEVRLFIDDVPVGTSQRSGADLRWVMLGATNITYENYWYDDVSVLSLDGDYNGDGATDASDYVMWRKYNQNNFDGYATWQASFGTSAAGSMASAADYGAGVPEPATPWPLALSGLALLTRSRCWFRV